MNCFICALFWKIHLSTLFPHCLVSSLAAVFLSLQFPRINSNFMCSLIGVIMQGAHRAADASPVLRRTPQPRAVGHVASLGHWGSVSASLCQLSLASGKAGSLAASHPRRRRNIHWRRVEGDKISSLSETRLAHRRRR